MWGTRNVWELPPRGHQKSQPGRSPAPTSAGPALTRQVGGRKVLALETFHMPSKHGCAWMVTVLSAPPRPAGATDTWTLGPACQASPFLRSGGVGGCLPVGASLGLVMAPGLGGGRPPRGTSGSSWLAGVCSRLSASRVSWCRCVVQASQLLSASGRHAGKTPGTGSLSRSRAERQGS